MAVDRISTSRQTLVAQPDISDTQKGQKRMVQPSEYDARSVNSELDYVHQRLNQIAVGDPAIDDLETTATLAQVIERLNLLTETMRKSGLRRRT